MKSTLLTSSRVRRAGATFAFVVVATLVIFTRGATAAPWNNIEPLKSKRADVERALGKPLEAQPGQQDGMLRFKVMGGSVTISFVDARFVANKKLDPAVEGTVLQIVLQHERSNDTPESMNLANDSDFQREDVQGGTIYRNLKDGIIYTFIGGRLKTTRYTPSNDELARARKQ
jgi:hypothetical protein